MSTEIWIWSVDYAGRHGGWAYVAVAGDGVRGAAGGRRDSAAGAMAIAALAEALRGAPPGAVTVYLPAPAAADAELRPGIVTALAGRAARLSAMPAPPKPATAGAFVAAWADQALDKVKKTGDFAVAIPKSNLLRFPR